MTSKQKIWYRLLVAVGVCLVLVGWYFTTVYTIIGEIREGKNQAGQTVEAAQKTNARYGNPIRQFRNWTSTIKDTFRKNIETIKEQSNL